MSKGQASVELMIILAVSLAVLITVFSYSSQSMSELNKQKLVDEAQVGVRALAKAANDVYYQGVGAKKKVFFTVPSGVDEGKSGIQGQFFLLNVLESDVYGKAEVCLFGEMPTSAGGHWVWLTAQEECVFIGIENIAVDKTSSYVTLSPNDSVDDNVTILNEGNSTAAITLVKSWAHSDVTLGLSTSSFSLAPGQQQTVTLTYSSDSTAVGNYAGSISIGAHFGSGDENISLPVNAEVVVSETDLLLFPTSYSTSLQGNKGETVDLNVCNNSESALSSISFNASGDIASWITVPSDITTLASGTCIKTAFDLNVPAGASSGDHTGTVTATDGFGGGSNTDSTSITVSVSTQDSIFSFKWGSVEFADCSRDECRRFQNFSIQNTSPDTEIAIDKITVSGWSASDSDNAKFTELRLDGTTRDIPDTSDGEQVDFTDITLETSKTSTSNRIVFNGQRIKDDCEYFSIVFEFSDGSTYSTSTSWPDYGGAGDFAFDWYYPPFSEGMLLKGNYLRNWRYMNKSSTKFLCIEKMRLRGWSILDQDNAKLKRIGFTSPNQEHWKGTADDGELLTLSRKKVVDPSEDQQNNNNIFTFSRPITDEGEDFFVDFVFSDGSEYNSVMYDG